MIIYKFERFKLAKRIQLFLKVHGMTQSEVGKALNMNPAIMSKIISGHGTNSETMVRVAYYLDIDLRDYITEIDSDTQEVLPRKERQLNLRL